MNRSPKIRSLTRSLRAASAVIALCAAPPTAFAQAPQSPLPESITVGAWTFRPLIDVRVRGEYRRHPLDAGGEQYASTAIFAQDYQSPLPRVTTTLPAVKDQYFVSERTRAGIAIDRGPVTAAVTLQDARAFGSGMTSFTAPGQPLAPAFAPYEAYLDVHTRSGRRVFFRVGRQAVTWGDGRMLGENDWSLTGRSLDAARFGFQIGDVDVEMLGAILSMPGTAGLAAGTTGSLGGLGSTSGSATVAGAPRGGSGAQLYGLDVTWHIFPLLHIELTGLARVARDPLPVTITPANTFVIDGRIFGDYRGFRYAVEGAYELGSVASYGENRDLRAFALAARASWETALPAHLTFGAEGAFASGDKGESTGTVKRFDPILPDEHTHLSPMSLFAWSNVIVGGGSISVRPIDELGFTASYRYAALAAPAGRWSNAALAPIGQVLTNTARSLGHEIGAAFKITPFSTARTFEIEPGYGLFVRGEGAGNLMRDAGRAATLQHWAYLQLRARLP